MNGSETLLHEDLIHTCMWLPCAWKSIDSFVVILRNVSTFKYQVSHACVLICLRLSSGGKLTHEFIYPFSGHVCLYMVPSIFTCCDDYLSSNCVPFGFHKSF